MPLSIGCLRRSVAPVAMSVLSASLDRHAAENRSSPISCFKIRKHLRSLRTNERRRSVSGFRRLRGLERCTERTGCHSDGHQLDRFLLPYAIAVRRLVDADSGAANEYATPRLRLAFLALRSNASEYLEAFLRSSAHEPPRWLACLSLLQLLRRQVKLCGGKPVDAMPTDRIDSWCIRFEFALLRAAKTASSAHVATVQMDRIASDVLAELVRGGRRFPSCCESVNVVLSRFSTDQCIAKYLVAVCTTLDSTERSVEQSAASVYYITYARKARDRTCVAAYQRQMA